jgi:hypothetical protein
MASSISGVRRTGRRLFEGIFILTPEKTKSEKKEDAPGIVWT